MLYFLRQAKTGSIYWWLIGVILVVSFGLFASKFWEVVGTYKLLFCLKRNTGSVVLTM